MFIVNNKEVMDIIATDAKDLMEYALEEDEKPSYKEKTETERIGLDDLEISYGW